MDFEASTERKDSVVRPTVLSERQETRSALVKRKQPNQNYTNKGYFLVNQPFYLRVHCVFVFSFVREDPRRPLLHRPPPFLTLISVRLTYSGTYSERPVTITTKYSSHEKVRVITQIRPHPFVP